VTPDWSRITDPQARLALAASLEVSGWTTKWAGLSAAEDAARRAVLHGFAAGQMPSLDASVLRALQARDVLVLGADGDIRAAYPFCAWESEHLVQLGTGMSVRALCAIDALGMGAMLGCDTVITSRCRCCGAAIRITTCDDGESLGTVAPDTTIVWSGIAYAGNCGATSGCKLKAFFCSEAHLRQWRAETMPEGRGFALSVAAAMQMGRALFVPMLQVG